MLRKVGRVVVRLALGAAGGALVLLVFGQIVGLFAPGCTVVCKPDVAMTLGALSGAVASFMIGDDRREEPEEEG